MKHLFELELEEIQCCNCLQTLGTYDPNTYTYDTKSWFATNNKLDYYTYNFYGTKREKIILEETEALTAIDVNTCSHKWNKENGRKSFQLVRMNHGYWYQHKHGKTEWLSKLK